MKIYKCKYGKVKNGQLYLFKLNNKTVAIEKIEIVKIYKRSDVNIWLKIFKYKEYRFVILLNNNEKIEFPFSQLNLKKALEFKNRILLNKFKIAT